MGLETGNYISDLDRSNPVGTADFVSEGDDHIRLVKKCVQDSLPDASRAFRFEKTVAVTTATTLDINADRAFHLCDASTGALTVTLPLGSTVHAGFVVSVIKSDSSGNELTLAPTAPNTINGSTTPLVSKFQFDNVSVLWDGNEWKLINEFIIGEEVVTFRQPQAADPAAVTEQGHLYTKKTGAGSKIELFWRDEDGNIVQLTSEGKLIVPVEADQIQKQEFVFAADTSGVANTITMTLSPAITAYSAGLRISTLVANTNTGAVNINVNGIGPAAAKKDQGQNDLAAGDLRVGQMAQFEYDGTNFQLVNPVPLPPTSAFTEYGESAPITTWTVGGNGTVDVSAFTPALTGAPKEWGYYWQCKSAVSGYIVGDKIGPNDTSVSNPAGVTIWNNGTTIGWTTNSSQINLIEKTSGVVATITPTNFDLVLTAKR